MKLKLSGKVILAALLALGLATSLGGCFSYHNDRDDRGHYEGDRHGEHYDSDRHEHEDVQVEVRH